MNRLRAEAYGSLCCPMTRRPYVEGVTHTLQIVTLPQLPAITLPYNYGLYGSVVHYMGLLVQRSSYC